MSACGYRHFMSGSPCESTALHSHCGHCGAWLDDTSGLCRHHAMTQIDWAEINRRACDFFHRGVIPPVLEAPDPWLSDEAWRAEMTASVATETPVDVA